jgi:hypothetical protein
MSSNKKVLKGAFLGWLFRDPDRIPTIFPISGEWRFVLFGLGAIQFARHPEGVIEYSKRRRSERSRAAANGVDSGSAPDQPSPAAAEVVG